MQADTGLVYSCTDLGKILKTFVPIEDNRRKLAMEPYPSLKELAVFAEASYSDCSGTLSLPAGWNLLTTAHSNSRTNGYFGCAFWSPSEQQVVVAHRGTQNIGSYWIDAKGVYLNSYTKHMNSAVTFSDEIKTAILKTNEQHGSRLVLSITGHSLGAWLAGVTTMTVKHLKRKSSAFCRIASPSEGLHPHTLCLDSPGVEGMLTKICRDYDVRYDRSMCIEHLDITTFFAAANLVNSTGYHVGSIYQVHISRDSKKSTLMGNIDTHSLDNFIKAFEEGKEIYKVQDWLQGSAERKYHHELERHCNSYILRPDSEEVLEPVEGNSYQDHLDIFLKDERAGASEGNVSNMSCIGSLMNKFASVQKEENSIIHYRSELSLGNTCHLGVFSMKELKFIQNWSLFQSNTIMKLTKIDKFVSHKQLDTIVFPTFQMNAIKNIISCETKEHLLTVIRLTKQLLRWFPTEIMDALAKQNRSIKSAPLYMAGQAYLHTLPDILDCQDTLGLQLFLESPVQRVLQIQTTDEKFEAARLYNILINLQNPFLDTKYLNKNYYTFLSWNDGANCMRDVDFKSFNKANATNLLILVSPTLTDYAYDDIFRKILRNLQKCSHKKLVIILPQTIDLEIFFDYDLTVVNKDLKLFELSDLAQTSREEILTRDAIAIGEETLSFNTLLGDACKSHDEQIQSNINNLVSPILKNLATDIQYVATISNKLPKLFELEALYTKGSKTVDKSKISTLMERTGADGPLLVIGDPEQRSQDYWGEVGEITRGRIFTTEEDGKDMFLEKCQKEPARIVYWLTLSAEGLKLKEIFNSKIYFSRKFHNRFIITSLAELVRNFGPKDFFIFDNVDDKRSMVGPFKILADVEKLFLKSDNFCTRLASRELSMENKMSEKSFNKHFFSMLTIGGTSRLVWQYSHGSLDGLRLFITRDCSDPIAEDDFYNMKKKVTIIAADPGMGKTTSLTRMSELIRDSWVLRIDRNGTELENAIEKLPLKLNPRSVADFLINTTSLRKDESLGRNLLEQCLKSDSSRQICIMVDAFDEINEEKTKSGMVELIKYLKNVNACKTVITTRVHLQERLENDLTELSTELEKISTEEQRSYLVKYWLPHLALEFPQYGVPEEIILRTFAKELQKEMEGVLGDDAESFMGIPLQIRMLAEVFLQQAILSVVSPMEVYDFSKIKNLFALYEEFINVKKTILFGVKIKDPLPSTYKNKLIANLMEEHRILAFQTIDPTFAKNHFKALSKEELIDTSRLGLLRSKTDETFRFIHRTFEEFFCADYFVRWLRLEEHSIHNNILIGSELGKFLTRSDYKIIRKFIDSQLEMSPIPSNVLERNPILYQHRCENRQSVFQSCNKTKLHVAVEEKHEHIVEVLLGGPSSRTYEEAYVCFIAARDRTGRTALKTALVNGNVNIARKIRENIDSCSYQSLLKIMLATFLDKGGNSDELFKEYCSNTQQSPTVSKALRRIREIRENIFEPFNAAVRDDDFGAVQKFISAMESDIERYYLFIAINDQGNNAINLAASKNKHNLFELLAKQGVSLSHDIFGNNPLHCAAEGGNDIIVNYLLKQSKEMFGRLDEVSVFDYDDHLMDTFQASTTTKTTHLPIIIKKTKPIQKYTSAKDTTSHKKVEYKQGVCLSHDISGNNPLHSAADGENDITVNNLLKEIFGRIDFSSERDYKFVQLEAQSGTTEKTTHSPRIIKKTEPIQKFTSAKDTISHKNVEYNFSLHINSQNRLGDTALTMAAQKGHYGVIRLLLARGADIDITDNYGNTALILAAEYGHLEVLFRLLHNGADIHSKNDLGYTALSSAALNGHHIVVHALLYNNADISSKNKHGDTALSLAAYNGHSLVVDFLLRRNVDLNFQNDDGNTALALAAYNGHKYVVEVLLQHDGMVGLRNNDDDTALTFAANRGHLDVVELLLKHGENLTSKNIDGDTALTLAACNGHYAVVEGLLKYGADIDSRTKNGWTALNYAAVEGHQEIVKLLLLKGANVDSRDEDGDTAFLQAAANGHAEIVTLLLQRGVDVNSRRDDGRTALSWAALVGQFDVLKVLLQHNADICCQDKEGKTALSWAEEKGHREIVELLRRHQKAKPDECESRLI